jgi:murein DD-endopeptidase MepM/ murein hydrolase activator NlpD
MATQKKKKKILGKKYQFTIYNDTDYGQVWKARLSGWLVLSIIIPVVVLIFFLFFLSIAYTPLRNLIPGYPNSETRQKIINNAAQIDSLESKVASWERYFNSIQAFVMGETDSIINESINVDSIINTTVGEFKLTPEDLAFRSEMENEELSRLSVNEKSANLNGTAYMYPPIKGEIVTKFDISTKHFGLDIQPLTSPIVMSTLDGIVIFSEWTLNDNYVIQIQHANNLISIYKGNSTVLKSVGDRVNAGEAIATIGITPNVKHKNKLHFELWQNGVPVDPTIYINF